MVVVVFACILCSDCLYLGLLSFLAEIFVIVLIVLHFIFIKNNVTTNEYCKETYETISGNPFAK